MNQTKKILKKYKAEQRQEVYYMIAEFLTGAGIFLLGFLWFSIL